MILHCVLQLLFGLCFLFFTGKFKEWTLTLHGTWEHPYQSHDGQSSQSKTPEIPNPGLVPGDTSQAPPGPEDLQEDEYNGKTSATGTTMHNE